MFNQVSTTFATLDLDTLRILPFNESHLTERYVSWLNDPDVVRYSEQRHHSHSLVSCTKYFQSLQNTKNYFLAIEAFETNFQHIGNMGVAIDYQNLTADMSVLIGEKRVWGKGFASRAWTAVLEELFNQGMRKVTAGTMAVNKPMLRLMQRAGMDIETVRPRHFLWEAKEVDLIQVAKFSNKNGLNSNNYSIDLAER